jgi:hypothetical protein
VGDNDVLDDPVHVVVAICSDRMSFWLWPKHIVAVFSVVVLLPEPWYDLTETGLVAGGFVQAADDPFATRQNETEPQTF